MAVQLVELKGILMADWMVLRRVAASDSQQDFLKAATMELQMAVE